jgi:hypothetical protein
MKHSLVLLALLATASFGCKATDHHAAADKAPSAQEMMAAMMRAGTPGAQHRALDPFVGTWNAHLTMWMDPAAPAEESTGKMVNAWILDGRYLEQRYEGEVGGQKFSGRGLWGYDVAANQYVGSWIDSMSTAHSTSVGPASKDGKRFEMVGVNTNPLDGKPSYGDQVITVDSPNQHTLTMYERRDGKQVKMMQIVYTRAK